MAKMSNNIVVEAPELALGMVYSLDLKHILLLEKTRPTWMIGCWNPPGGHIEADETPAHTARREVMEECGLDINHWVYLDTPKTKMGLMPIFITRTALIHQAKTLTEEQVRVFSCEDLEQGKIKCLPELLGRHQQAMAKFSEGF